MLVKYHPTFRYCFLAHLSQRLKWAIVIAHRPSSVRPSVVRCPSVRKLSHFQLLLWNHWTEFNETSQEARSQHPLPSLCFSGWSEKQDGRPGLWLAETFSTSPLKPLNGIQRNLTGSKISTPSIKFVFFGLIGKTTWPPWPLIGRDIFDFSSETAERNSTKLDRKQDLNALYQVCVFRADWKNKMAALASDWLRHFRLLLWNRWTEFKETWQEPRSQSPLPSLCFSGRSEKTRWPPWPLIGWDIFDFSSETAEPNSMKFDRKQDLKALYQVCVFWADQKNKMAALASDWPRHFRLLLWNRWMEFNETWQEARSKRPLPSMCFWADRKDKMAALASDWLRHFRLLLWNRWTEFNETWQEASSQCLLPRLCFSGQSGKKTKSRPWPLIGWDIFDFSSETAERNWTKLDRKQDLNALYLVCVFRVDRKNKMAAPAYDLLRHFQLILWNHLIEFNKTWQ